MKLPRVLGWLMIALVIAVMEAGCAPAAPEVPVAPPVTQQVVHDDLTINVTATPGSAEVGTTIELVIEVEGPDGALLEMPVLGETLGAFMVRLSSRPPDVPTSEGRRWRHRYELSAFEVGIHSIELPSVTRTDREPALVLSVPSLMVSLEAVEEETRGLQGGVAIDLPIDMERLLKYGALGCSALLALLGVVWWWWRRTHQPFVPPPPVPAHVTARNALNELRASGLIEAGRWERFYDELSSIVRLYVEARFALRAPESTTDEFLRDARRNPALSETQRHGLGTFLRAADLVKFARHRPNAVESSEALDHADQFVRETTPESIAGEVAP